MKLQTLEKKLMKLKNEILNEEIFIPIKGWKNYLISNFGTVKSLDKKVIKKCPRSEKQVKYVYKGKILKPLLAGIDGRWKQVRLTNEKNEWRQLSIVKLMISSFLKIHIDDLPHSIYFINGNTEDINLNNLTFFMPHRKN